MMMKNFFVGVCLAVLLCFSACDSGEPALPSFPISEIALKDVVSLADVMPDSVESAGIYLPLDRSIPVFYFSGKVVRDSYLQSLGGLSVVVSPVKEYLTDENLPMFMYRNEVRVMPCEFLDEFSYQCVLEFYEEKWDADTFYYRVVSVTYDGFETPGILGDCLGYSYGYVCSEIKSFPLPLARLPKIQDYELREEGIMIYGNWSDLSEFSGNIVCLGICFTTKEKVPVLEDGFMDMDYSAGSNACLFAYPAEKGILNVRPYVKLADGRVVYGYVREMQIW